MRKSYIINIVVDKQGKPLDYDAFSMAWKVLTQRFENTLSNRNFRGPVNQDERGMVIPDRTDDKKFGAVHFPVMGYRKADCRIPYLLVFGETKGSSVEADLDDRRRSSFRGHLSRDFGQ